MTDWLSDIEKSNKKLRGEFVSEFGYDPDESVTELMARVIRELAEYIELTRSGVSFFQIEHAFKNLSPDAKELIDDSTAPSST